MSKRRSPMTQDHASTMRVARVLLVWAGLSFPLHLVWEVAQLPLYALWRESDLLHIAWAVLHCTVGDVLIACACFGMVSVGSRTTQWPSSQRRLGLALLLIGGVAYTAFSEWFNVYRLGSWGYTAAMPTVWGIGLSPILQWLLVPALTMRLYIRYVRRTG